MESVYGECVWRVCMESVWRVCMESVVSEECRKNVMSEL